MEPVWSEDEVQRPMPGNERTLLPESEISSQEFPRGNESAQTPVRITIWDDDDDDDDDDEDDDE